VTPENYRHENANRKAVEVRFNGFSVPKSLPDVERKVLVARYSRAFRFGFAQAFELHNRSVRFGLLFQDVLTVEFRHASVLLVA
jgi:hypothetical protein